MVDRKGPHVFVGEQSEQFLKLALEQEKNIETDRLPRVGDFCVAPVAPDSQGVLSFENDWKFKGFLGDQAHLLKEEGEPLFIDKKRFLAMNFVNATFVLEKAKEDCEEVKGASKEEGKKCLQAFYDGEIDKVLDYVVKKMNNYEDKIHKYKECRLLEKAIAGLITSNNKYLQNILFKKQQVLSVLKSELNGIDYEELEESLEKFITAIHSLVFVKAEIEKLQTKKLKK